MSINRRYIKSNRRPRYKRHGSRRIKALPIRIAVLLFIVALVSAIAYSTCKKNATAITADQSLAGEPSLAQLAQVNTPDITDGQMLHYPGFDIYFSPNDHQPYYGAWIITAENVRNSKIKRTNNFRPDPDVEGCATLADYRNSGYDRGHIVPAGDCRYSTEAMNASFLLTNMSPQVSDLNSKTWNTLEENCRNWAKRDSVLIVIAGPILTDYLPLTIGKSKVTVPDRYFKVILAPYADPPRAIGFIMENRYNPGGLQSTAVSVDQVEEITGYDFFAALPDQIENDIESEARYTQWQRTPKKRRR